jgi:hypothetical protein
MVEADWFTVKDTLLDRPNARANQGQLLEFFETLPTDLAYCWFLNPLFGRGCRQRDRQSPYFRPVTRQRVYIAASLLEEVFSP